MTTRTSFIWNIEKSKLQEILDNGLSISDVMRKLGFNPHNGSSRTLHQRIVSDNLSLEKLKQNQSLNKFKIVKQKLEDILVENSAYSRKSLKNRLVKEGLLKYECERCKNNGEWMGVRLSLQLEHKNGKNNDNRLENLCLLCPNCHSQSLTYAGKNKPCLPKKIFYCKECHQTVLKSKDATCRECLAKKYRKFDISPDDLKKMIHEKPFTEIGRMFGVSCNAIRDRCEFLGIDMPKHRRGYWSRLRALEKRTKQSSITDVV